MTDTTTPLTEADKILAECAGEPEAEERLATLCDRLERELAAATLSLSEGKGKLWLWRNFVDGRPEYWAFDNPHPIHLDNGDPQTLGEPCGYAVVKPSRNGRPDVPESKVLAAIDRALKKEQAPYAELLKRAADPLRIIVEDLAQDITPTAAWRKEVLAEWARVASQSGHEIVHCEHKWATDGINATQCVRCGAISGAERGHAVGNPQPLEMLGELTVYMKPPTAAADADADVDAIKRGGQVVKWDAPELYFHQLRLRVALEPELAKRIAVVYIDAPDSHRKVGLAFDDELRWPVGFCNEAWGIESKIAEARGRGGPQTIPSQVSKQAPTT